MSLLAWRGGILSATLTGTVPEVPSGGGDPGGGSFGVPAEPTVPAFSPTITINPGDNAASIIDQAPVGAHIRVAAGTHNNWEDVRPRNNQVIRGDGVGNVLLNGSGKGYCVRARSQGQGDDVTLGGFTARGYGFGGTAQSYGAIQGRDTDTLNNQYTYGNVENWFVHDVQLELNGANALRLGDNWTVYRVVAFGHNVTGINGDRVVGGLVHSCTLSANALNPATGAQANGANLKTGWHNAGVGRTSITPIDRDPAPFWVVNTVFNATHPQVTGTCRIGLWYDLDCRACFSSGCTYNNHPATSVFYEGCNYGGVYDSVVNNSDGYGAGLGSNFANAALSCGESTNIEFIGNELNDCNFALMNRMSNRSSDWYNSDNSSFLNYSWPTSSGGARYWIDSAGPTPVPTDDVTGWSNHWTGGNSFITNALNNCNRVVINEGTNAGGHNVVGSTPLSTIVFDGNDYSGSPSIQFYEASNTALTLAQWRALPNTRDQV